MKKPLRLAAIWVALLLIALPWIGCDGGGSNDPDPANLSGIVRRASTEMPLPGVTVTTGGLQTTTDAEGRFTLSDVPTGTSVLIEASLPGFTHYAQRIAVQAGDNRHDIALAPQTIYGQGDIIAYISPDVPTFNGVIFALAGSEGDFRPFVRGDELLPPEAVDFRQRTLALAETYELALLGANRMSDDNDTYNAMLAALTEFADRSGHPELAQAPLLLWGYSLGGCVAYSFSRRHSERVIGFVTQKGGCHELIDAEPARSVPGYLFIGERDTENRFDNITQLFEQNRSGGAPWAVAVEPEAEHGVVADNELMANWIEAVLERRLPETGAPGALRPIDEASGWLGNRTSFTIAPYACYEGDKLAASWLPSEQTARDWQAFVSMGTATAMTTCGTGH